MYEDHLEHCLIDDAKLESYDLRTPTDTPLPVGRREQPTIPPPMMLSDLTPVVPPHPSTSLEDGYPVPQQPTTVYPTTASSKSSPLPWILVGMLTFLVLGLLLAFFLLPKPPEELAPVQMVIEAPTPVGPAAPTHLRLRVEPEGTRVLAEGADLCTSPCDLAGSEIALPLMLTLEHDGYQTETYEVRELGVHRLRLAERQRRPRPSAPAPKRVRPTAPAPTPEPPSGATTTRGPDGSESDAPTEPAAVPVPPPAEPAPTPAPPAPSGGDSFETVEEIRDPFAD